MPSDRLAPGAARVRQVNVSAGGVPKLPVSEAWVDRFGLKGDMHNDETEHGGPRRAVSLLGIEAIRRVAADGHPIGPGTTGENLTVEGFDMSSMPIGTRLAVGETLVIELTGPANPCQTIRDSFVDHHIARLSIELHPRDSRMYASVVTPGPVRPGDPIKVLGIPVDSTAERDRLLDRITRAAGASAVAHWKAAQDGGVDVRFVQDGELVYAATPAVPGPTFNEALGLTALPHLRERVEAHYRDHASVGWLWTAEASRPDLEPDLVLDVFAAQPLAVGEGPLPPGVTVRRVGALEAHAWAAAVIAADGLDKAVAGAWRAMAQHLVRRAHVALFLAEQAGRPVGAASVQVKRGVAFLRVGSALAGTDGGAVERALVSTAVAHAADDEDADLAAVFARPSSPTADRLLTMGFERVGGRRAWRFDPSRTAETAAPPPDR